MRRVLELDGTNDAAILAALAAAERLAILHLIGDQALKISDIARKLNLPQSTTTNHIQRLEQAGLLTIEYTPGIRGSQKLCSRCYDEIILKFCPSMSVVPHNAIELSTPIGQYTDFDVYPPCGLASETRVIGLLDDPRSFFHSERGMAQLVWFARGYIEYRFPNYLPGRVHVTRLNLGVEICSEVAFHNPDWPSDITIWIGGVEIGTWTSPGDFGGEGALLTPDWWPPHHTTHGLIKRFTVTEKGSFVDGTPLSAVCLDDINLVEQKFISVRIGIKPGATNVGGVNVFGARWGNYPQDLVLRVEYDPLPTKVSKEEEN